MDFLELFFGFFGRLLLGWEPRISPGAGTTTGLPKGGHQGDPDG